MVPALSEPLSWPRGGKGLGSVMVAEGAFKAPLRPSTPSSTQPYKLQVTNNRWEGVFTASGTSCPMPGEDSPISSQCVQSFFVVYFVQ